MSAPKPRPASGPSRHAAVGEVPAYLEAYKKKQNETLEARQAESSLAADALARGNRKREKKRSMVEGLLRQRIEENLAEYVRVQHASDIDTGKRVARKEALEKVIDRLRGDLDKVAGEASESESRAKNAAKRIGMYCPEKGDGARQKKGARPFVPPPWPPL